MWLVFALFLSLAYAQPHPDTLWTYEYPNSGLDQPWSVGAGVDSGYIVAGCLSCFSSSQVGCVIRLTPNGDTLWTARLDSVFLFSTVRSDSSYAVAGFIYAPSGRSHDAFLALISDNGTVLWSRAYGGNLLDRAKGITRLTDDGYILAGYSRSFSTDSSMQAYVIRTESNGDTLWTRTYSESAYTDLRQVIEASDGGYIGLGTTGINAADTRYWVVKLDNSGQIQWTRTYGTVASEIATGIVLAEDNGYVICGWLNLPGDANNQIYLVRINQNGDTLWSRLYGDIGIQEVNSSQIISTTNGYAILGTLFSSGQSGSFYLLATDLVGDTLWSCSYHRNGEYGTAACQTTRGSFVLVGTTSAGVENNSAIYAMETGPVQFADAGRPRRDMSKPEKTGLSAFPNPFNQTTAITFYVEDEFKTKIALYDTSGREVRILADKIFERGEHMLIFDGRNLPSGLYLLRLESESLSLSQKLLLLR